MQIAPLTRIDCVLLHETGQDLPESDLKTCVTAVLTAAGLTPVEEPAESAGEGRTLVFRAGSWRLRVRSAPTPLARETLKNVLPLPYTRTIFPDAEQVAQAHAAHTWLSLEKAIDGQQNQTAAFTDSREAMPAMSLVALLAREIMSRRPATAIYWAPSDHLLPPTLFQTLTSDTRLILLNIRPQYFTGPASAGQPQPVGMIAWGTQYLVGKLLVIEAGSIPPGDLHSLSAGITATIMDNGKLPTPGDRLTAPETEWDALVHAYAAWDQAAGIEALQLRPVRKASRWAADVLSAANASAEAEAMGTASMAESGKPQPSSENTDADLSVLPPDVREEILESRKRRYKYTPPITSSFVVTGGMQNTSMYLAGSVLGFAILAKVMGGMALAPTVPSQKPPPTEVAVTSEIDRANIHQIRTQPVPRHGRKFGIAYDEDDAREERPRDEERDVMREDRPVDEERELQQQSDGLPDEESRSNLAGNFAGNKSALRDDAREDEDLMRD